MKRTLTIKTISKKSVDTKFGQKEKWIVSFEEKELTADSFMGKWNEGWEQGKQIEILDSQWKSREWEGKTYWSIMAPPAPTREDIDELKAEINDLKTNFESLNNFVQSFLDKKQEESLQEEKTPEQKEYEEEDTIKPSDIPF